MTAQHPTRLVSAPAIAPIVAPPVRDGAVVIDEAGTVLAVGRRRDLRATYAGLPEVRAEGTLMPGLVNAHTHFELAALAGKVPGGDGLVSWTQRLIKARAPAVDAQRASGALDEAAAARRAAEETQRAGVAAAGDVGNGTIGWRAMAEAGLGGVFFHELLGSREARTGDAIVDAERERERERETSARKWPHGAWSSAAALESKFPPAVAAAHAPYSCGPALLRRIFAAAGAAERPTTIHLAEDPDELALARDGSGGWAPVLAALGVDVSERAHGMGPTAYLETLGAFAARIPPLLVHMVHASDDDRRRASQQRAPIVLCPRSNLHIGGQLPDVPALVERGCRLAIGTDSLASAPDVSPWGEVALLARRFPGLPPSLWLQAATLGGARALGLSALGALAPGLRPGLLDVVAGGSQPVGATEDPERLLVSDPTPCVRWLAPPMVTP